jgi:hypothetical protein
MGDYISSYFSCMRVYSDLLRRAILMEDVKVGDEYWTWLNGRNPVYDNPLVRKIKIKEVFTVMVVADVIDSFGQVEVPKKDLYQTQDEALEALHKVLDEVEK